MLEDTLRLDGHLFAPAQHVSLAAFAAAPPSAQSLALRLFLRAGPWFRVAALEGSYEDVQDVATAVAALEYAGLAVRIGGGDAGDAGGGEGSAAPRVSSSPSPPEPAGDASGMSTQVAGAGRALSSDAGIDSRAAGGAGEWELAAGVMQVGELWAALEHFNCAHDLGRRIQRGRRANALAMLRQLASAVRAHRLRLRSGLASISP